MGDEPAKCFGLRFWIEGHPVRLLQIAGAGRLRLERQGRIWWSAPPRDVAWEVYPASTGQLYPSHDAAQEVAQNLVGKENE